MKSSTLPIRKTDPIVILTGAGISAESGLKTFRAGDGLWEDHRVEDVATPEAFQRNPDLVQRFYNARRRQLKDAAVKPNAAHLALADLQKKWKAPALIVTQNVDNLHERAGSEAVIHMHGELNKVRCLKCGEVSAWEDDLEDKSKCGSCEAVGQLRPHIVWFGEIPLEMEEIDEALSYAGLFLSIGTSGLVYPAAGFVQVVRSVGHAHAVELNLEPTSSSSLFHEHRVGSASETVPQIVKEILSCA